jgi:hypothetical protein
MRARVLYTVAQLRPRAWRADLIESRRRLRLILLVVAGTYSSAAAGRAVPARPHSGAALQLMNALPLMLPLFSLACAILSPFPAVREAFGWSPAARSATVAGRDCVCRTTRQLRIARSLPRG